MRTFEGRLRRRSGGSHVLAIILWVALVLFALVDTAQALLGWSFLAAAAVVARLILLGLGLFLVVWNAWVRPAQRAALVSLAIGVAVWMAGAFVIATTTDPQTPQLPLSPAEWLFVASYLGFAAFLLLDVHGRAESSPVVWLEAVILTGGAVCLAAVLVLIPAASMIEQVGISLFIAMLYPVCDVLMLLIIAAQVGLRARDSSWRTLVLVVAFVCFTAADLIYAEKLAAGRYEFPVFLNVLWAAGLVCLMQGACLTRRPAKVVASPHIGRRSSLVLVPAGLVAVMVLVVPHPTERIWLVEIPALITLAAVAMRAWIAIQAANAATESYRQAITDELTSLPNRRGILALMAASADTGRRSLLVIGVDDFTDVNNSLGHSNGDEVLRLCAVRLREAFPAQVPVGRLESDIFVVVLPITDDDEANRTAQVVQQTLGAPLRIADVEIVLSVSVGIEECSDAEPAEDVRRALVAMHHAKAAHTSVLDYRPADDERGRKQLHLAEELRLGLADGHIVVWYQPQVDAHCHRVVGVEALVRWIHPVRGVIFPNDFLPVARRAGLMPALTREVFAQALTDAVRWRSRGRDWTVSVNLAPPELISGSVMPELLKLVRAAALPRGALVVEVTEESFLSDPERAVDIVRTLRQHGVDVSVDDYGTGFSSLSYLRDMDVTELKIDQAFISSMVTDHRSEMIVRSTVTMAHSLDVRVVAEGVELPQTAGALLDADVDVLQGFLFARAMARADLENWCDSAVVG